MVEAKNVEVKDSVKEEVTTVKTEVAQEKESVMDKIKGFGRKHKKPLIIVGTVVLGLGAIVAKALWFPGDMPDGLEVDADESIEVDAVVE